MQLNRVVAGALGAGLLGLSLAACAHTTDTSGTSIATTVPPTTSAPVTTATPTTGASTTSTTAASTTTTTAVPAAAPACVHSALEVAEGHAEASTGPVDVPVTIANIGTSACSLGGYPDVSFTVGSGVSEPTVVHTGQARVFKIAPTLVTLAPGGSASAGFVVEYYTQPEDGETTCPQVSGFDVTFTSPGGTFEVTNGFPSCGDIAISPIVTAAEASVGSG